MSIKTKVEGLRSLAGAAILAVPVIAYLLISPQLTHAQLGAPQTWLGTAGGTANALTLNVHNVALLGDLLGVPLHFLPGSVNTASATITVNLDGGGALGPVVLDRVTSNIGLQALSGGELVTAVLTQITYDGTEFVITSAIDMTPIGDAVEVRGTAAPRGTLLEDGTCYSQTTYAALFTVVGTQYNANAPVACSGGQFAVPYSNGTAFVAQDNQGATHVANRITSAGSGCNGQAFASLCGSQNQTLTLGQLPAGIAVSGSNTITVNTSGSTFFATANTGWGQVAVSSGAFADVAGALGSCCNSVSSLSGTNTVTGASTNTNGLPHPILPPLLIGLRAIKY